MSTSIPKPARPVMPTQRSPFEIDARADSVTAKAAASPAAAEQNAPAAPAQPSGRVVRKIMLELDEAQKARMEATHLHTAGITGLRSQQAFIREAITRLCAELEAQHNGGVAFTLPPST